MRRERFRPIADEAIAIWGQLRQNSNVRLDSVELAGTSTQRRVTLEVTVDGVPGAALSVMSQGELNTLALSLFMPRAALPEVGELAMLQGQWTVRRMGENSNEGRSVEIVRLQPDGRWRFVIDNPSVA